jgi:hypothetical protein
MYFESRLHELDLALFDFEDVVDGEEESLIVRGVQVFGTFGLGVVGNFYFGHIIIYLYESGWR